MYVYNFNFFAIAVISFTELRSMTSQAWRMQNQCQQNTRIKLPLTFTFELMLPKSEQSISDTRIILLHKLINYLIH